MDMKESFIDGTNMSDEQLKGIPAGIVNLNFEGAKITDKGISNIPFLHNIKSLNVSNTLITEKSLKVIATFTTIENLWMNDIKLNGDYSLDTLVNLSFLAFGDHAPQFVDDLSKY
jgi:hypothetical protein